MRRGEPPYRQRLAGDLVLCTAANERDVERVAELNGIVHGPGIAPVTRNLYLHHPATSLRDLVFVEDGQTGQVISSLCLIPWTWRFEGVVIPAGEMGIVGTLEAYRRRGLVRAQVELFKQRLHERDCLISHIQGIPYYYRQFGYEYALPLEGGLLLELRQVPDVPDLPFTFRRAAPADIPVLARLYEQAAHDLAISVVRDRATWRYLLTYTDGTEMECDTMLIEDSTGSAAGYLRIPKSHFGSEVTVNEVSRLSFDAALACLGHLKRLAEERAKPGIRLCLPAASTPMRVGRSLGAHDLGTYAWQIHIPDPAALLQKLAPVLERRIAGSPFAGITRDVQICLFRETISLRFEQGQVMAVRNLGFTERGDISFPPQAFVSLVLGYRSAEELKAIYPDVSIRPLSRLLVNTLFPKLSAFLYTVY